MIFKGVGESQPYPAHGLDEPGDWAHLPPRMIRLDELVTTLMHTFPDCTRKTLESLRKKKLEHWYANSETNRSWLALNMNTEAAAGFPAFHFGDRHEREIDFVKLRKLYAEGRRFDDEFVSEVRKDSSREGWKAYRKGGKD